ncbi:outer membrane beta-barrel protein [Cellulophaga sp. HaHa_2_95]|uniref:PorT family protein n=1 Tax=Cellulophaga sp. HaHa_2_95 TaxID=2745558 RepID=UPI001C4EA493|nr:PorT family protein [Cellulophaga sp. HaHa_2_95]QXP56545.1 outer membrane beta-barrel protein [Cellulophaga sp. HaHa_2_95]
MSKKNLDELFREQFRDFDEVPDDKVWTAIEASLDQKKSRKLIPVWWWKLGGIAAASLFLLYVINPFSTEIETQPSVTDVEHPVQEHSKEAIEKSKHLNSVESSHVNMDEEFDADAEEQDNFNTAPSYVVNEIDSLNNAATKENSAAKTQTASLHTYNTKFTEANKQGETTTSTSIQSSELASNTKKGSEPASKSLEGLADGPIHHNNNNKPLENNDGSGSAFKNKGNITELAVNVEEDQLDKKEGKKKSIFDEIEDDEVLIAEHKANKWSVSPSIAPVYFNGLGEGSPIHSAFISNSKTGNVNLSYGVAVAYEVTKRLKVRSGIHKVDYGYNTNQIEFSSSVNSAATVQIANIDYKTTSKNIVVQSELNLDSKAGFVANDATAKSPSLNGDLSQQFGYLEVPLELNYALLDKRFGIDVIGGVSSLFLLNNDVFLNSGDQTTEVGEANNINDINFSTNFGFGFNYKLTQKLLFNLEPVFKYQLNTFSNTAGDFQPFSVGVYSGVSFRF